MGKYIKKFDTHSDYEDFIETEDFIRPNVSYCVDNKDVHYNSIQTLFAIEFEAGKFAFGHASEDEIFLATKDGFSELWYADENGVITGNTPHAAMAHNIIDAYNEHYGTDINIWTPETKTLQVGDTVPNWNTYEKIEISSRKIAFNMQSTSPIYIFGTIEGNILHLEVDNQEHSWYADTEGNILDSSGPGIKAKTWIIEQFGNKGISITDVVANIVQYDEGDIVPNWSEYEKII